jgi:hypothetical protein
MRLFVVIALLLIGLSACAGRPVMIDRFIPQNGTSFAGACHDVPDGAYSINVCLLPQPIAYYDLRGISDETYVLVVA